MADDTNLESQVQRLQQQNQSLQEQLRRQQETIESLSRDVAAIRRAGDHHEPAAEPARPDDSGPAANARPSGFGFGKVQLSGEGGVGIFESGSRGMFPNAEFRVDEAKLFVDAPVWGDVYAFAELNLATRESPNVNVYVGELYVDFEDVSQLWGRDRQLNVRVGRMDIPFGEEYLHRDAIDDPLISHSISDLWGQDEGVELYGALGRFSYAAAVQNGGIPPARDFMADKSIAGRLSYDPNRWLHLSASGMRTGQLDAKRDFLSDMWFGNWWFQSLGSTNTRSFEANVFEGDIRVALPRGHLSAFGGAVFYNDRDPGAQNSRDVYFYSIECVQNLTRRWYGAARFSQIFARKGFPIVANGNATIYSGQLTTDAWLLSLGVGYRWNRHLVWKAEYSIERGRLVGGGTRDREDWLATEMAFAF